MVFIIMMVYVYGWASGGCGVGGRREVSMFILDDIDVLLETGWSCDIPT